MNQSIVHNWRERFVMIIIKMQRQPPLPPTVSLRTKTFHRMALGFMAVMAVIAVIVIVAVVIVMVAR